MSAPPQQPASTTAIARAVEAARAIAAARGLDVHPVAGDAARLTLEVRDRDGEAVRFTVERKAAGARSFRSSGALVVWYRAASPEPTWLREVVGALADALLAPEHAPLAAELAEPARAERFPTPTVLDMVRAGLKPAASLLVGDDVDPGSLGLPATATSRLALARDALGNLVVDRAGGPGALRMLYAGRDQATVERLRDIDEALVTRRGGAGSADAEALQEEFGRLIGYPPCCTRAFAASYRSGPGTADLHASIARLGWHLLPVPARLNHVVAHLYHLPFLIHVPCSDACAPTLAAVEAALERLYPPPARRTIDALLGHAAIVLPDDRVVLARPLGAPRDGVLAVEAFNVDPFPEARPAPRSEGRAIARDAGGFADAEVTALRSGRDGLEVRVAGVFRPYAPRDAARGQPFVLVPRAPA